MFGKLMERDLSTQRFKYNLLSKNDRVKTNAKARRMEIAVKIKSLRRIEREMSAKLLAKKAKVNLKTLSKIENGKPVKLDSLLQVVEALDCKLEIEVDL
ncbi:helix-turn-helix domain-containing protein [Candidatus Dojkabacteria bacterium]|nr:helix-turn-helix domain-containing protein [Candidatus Dojkabacteria bacterium]